MTSRTTVKKDRQLNKISFYRNGKQVFDFIIKGNIVTFSTGEMILI